MQASAIAAGAHPDADLLTAFAEQSLASGERDFVMEHLARCGDCRDVVVLALPEVEIVIPTAPARVPSMGWLRWPALRWGALAAGILAVASVGVVQHERKTQDSVQDRTVASNVASQPSSVNVATPNTAPADGEAAKPSISSTESIPLPRAEKPPTSTFTPSKHTGPSHVRLGAAEGGELARNRIDLPMAQSPENFDVVKAKDPVPIEASIAQWAVTSDGGLQRSYDQGQTWQIVDLAAGLTGDQAATSSVTMIAVTTNGSEVWAGGTAGAIFHSLDGGNSWTHLSISAGGVPLTGDVSSIQFSDPQHGTIATSNGDLWATSDAGQTWAKQ